MSASGVKLFDDDLAADVRDQFRDLLQRGKTGPQATALLIENFQEVFDTEEETVFWLALAAVQWDYGLLVPQLLERALRIVEDGTDLTRWANDTKLQRQRQKVLISLAKQLRGPNNNPKKARLTRTTPKCEWERGDVFAYCLQSGTFILLRVVAVRRSWVQELPICELLDWVGTDIPNSDVVSVLPILRNKRYDSESKFYFPMTKKHLSRCHSLNLRLAPTMREDGGYVLALNFDALPTDLHEYFGLSVENTPMQEST